MICLRFDEIKWLPHKHYICSRSGLATPSYVIVCLLQVRDWHFFKLCILFSYWNLWSMIEQHPFDIISNWFLNMSNVYQAIFNLFLFRLWGSTKAPSTFNKPWGMNENIIIRNKSLSGDWLFQWKANIDHLIQSAGHREIIPIPK